MSELDIDAYKGWSPHAQQKALALLQARRNDSWRPFFCGDRSCTGRPHGEWEWNHARGDQYPPAGDDWLTWLITSGRGGGKTRCGAEVVHQASETVGRIAIIAATGADVRDTLVEGESGLKTIARPDRTPKYEPSKRRLTWPNGCIGTTFSGEEPDRLRGPEHGFAWVDEGAHIALIQDVWDNLLFGLRIGRRPRVVVTTTPKPRPWLKELIKDPRTFRTVTSTYANLDNLAPTFAETVIGRYEGTRLGRQELHGELLEDVEGALWTSDMIEIDRVELAPRLVRTVVGVDPAGSSRASADETAIVVAGRDKLGEMFPLADYSGRMSPLGWANAVMRAVDEHQADAVVAERNYGGDMVEHTLRTAGFNGRVITIHARKGKDVRAEPIVGLYEQHLVHHVGVMAELEAEMTGWVPYSGDPSPNRLDALVYALTVLAERAGAAEIVSPTQLHVTTPGMVNRREVEALRRSLMP